MAFGCRQVRAYTSDLGAGRVDLDVLEQIGLHLQSCESCSQLMRDIALTLETQRTFELPIGFSDRLHKRLQAAFDPEN